MRIHSPKKIERLKELRKEGYSINELVKELAIPKTTVWHHIHEIKLSPKSLSLLKQKIGGSKERKEKNLHLAKELAIRILNSPDRELAIAFAMLYWAEGSKKVCEFINSDGRMINLYLQIIKKILRIPDERISPTMRIFSGMNKEECLEYWSSITGLSKDKFSVRMNDGGTRSNTKYGMCRIRVNKGSNTLKLIHSLIGEYYNELIKSL